MVTDGIQVLLAMVFLGFLVYLVGKVLLKPFKLIFKLLYNSIAGLLALWFINLLGAYLGFHLPVNWLTVLLVGFLGIPGLLLVIVLKLLIG